MQCAKCGATLDHAGQAHNCGPAYVPPTEPPTGWTVAAYCLMGLSALFAATSVVYAVVRLQVLNTATVTPLDQLGASAFSIAIIALIVASVLWRRSTRRLVDSQGADGRRFAQHWGYRVYAVALFLVLYVQWGAGVNNRNGIVVTAVLRCVAALALIGGVVHTWVRIRRLMAGPVREHFGAQQYSLVTGAAEPDPLNPLAPNPTHMDWNAAQWDPDIQAEIERRRHRNPSS